MNLKIKNNIKKILLKCPGAVIRLFYQLYNRAKYPEMMEKKTSYGEENREITIYIIRPRTDGVEGLMALLMGVIKNLNYAEKKRYISVVDFKNYHTQYADGDSENINVWDYFFEPVSDFSLSAAYRSKKVVLSGLNAILHCDEYLNQRMDKNSLEKARGFVRKRIRYSKLTNNRVKSEINDMDLQETLGLYIRGTDYTKLKPAGHPIQPSTEQAIRKADEFLKQYNLKKVFLVTEDYDIYIKIKEHYGNRLRIVSFDSFISGYSGDNYLSLNNGDLSQLANTAIDRGMNYLVKIIILSKCKCFVGGNTCGSWAAQVLSDGYEDSYVFDLGRY